MTAEIRRIMASVPRELFIPDLIYVRRPPHNHLEPLNRGDEPDQWTQLVHSDDPVVTAIAPHPMGPVSVSSSSSVVAMAKMIDALNLSPGIRVLEIGTGTGWNAACMAAFGAEVISIEIDATIAAQARANLETAGYGGVTVLAGDGEHGAPEFAPFDRIISTGAVRIIPYTWVEQCKDGGRIVTPYAGLGHLWALLELNVSNEAATGRVIGEVSFMPLHGQEPSDEELDASEFRDDLRITVTKANQRITYLD